MIFFVWLTLFVSFVLALKKELYFEQEISNFGPVEEIVTTSSGVYVWHQLSTQPDNSVLPAQCLAFPILPAVNGGDSPLGPSHLLEKNHEAHPLIRIVAVMEMYQQIPGRQSTLDVMIAVVDGTIQCFEIKLNDQVPLVFICNWELKCDPHTDPIVCTVDNIYLSHDKLNDRIVPLKDTVHIVQQEKASNTIYVKDLHIKLDNPSTLILSCSKFSHYLYISLSDPSILCYYFGFRESELDEFKKCSLQDISSKHRSLNLQIIDPKHLLYDSYVFDYPNQGIKEKRISVESEIYRSFYDKYYRGMDLPEDQEFVTLFPTFHVLDRAYPYNRFYSMQGIPQASGQILFVLLSISHYNPEWEIHSSEASHVSLNLPGNPVLFSAYPGEWAFFAWVSKNGADGSEKLHFCSVDRRKILTRFPELQQNITSLVDKHGSDADKKFFHRVVVASMCILVLGCLLLVMTTTRRLPRSPVPKRSRKTNMRKKASFRSKNSPRRGTSAHGSK
jgi:hypothetical protein